MKKFFEKVDLWIEEHIKLDDTLHFIAGLVVAILVYMIAFPFFGPAVDFNLVSVMAVFGSLLAAFVKEFIDANIKCVGWSRRDMLCTLLGGIFIAIVMTIFKSMDIFVDAYTREIIMNSLTN